MAFWGRVNHGSKYTNTQFLWPCSALGFEMLCVNKYATFIATRGNDMS